MHKLLARQLRKVGQGANGDEIDVPALLDLVSAAYEEFDRERQLSARAHRLMTEERKAADMRLRDAVAHVGVGFSIWDPEDRLLLCNDQFRAQWQDLGVQLRPGLSFNDFFDAVTAAGGIEVGKGQHEAFVADPLVRPHARMRFSEVQMANGRTIRFRDVKTSDGCVVSASTDITEAEQELRYAKDRAEIASRAKTDFLANMSHELRTPLNAVLGFSEIIGAEAFGAVGNPRYIEYARDINDSARHLLEIINDILDMSTIEAGKIELHEEVFSVERAAADCILVIEERARRAGITVRNDIDSRLPQLRADERMCKQMLLNLLSNAVKFTPSGGVITVSASIDETGDFRLSVRDTGIGMTPKQIEEVALPFHQVESAFSRKYAGTGLGLPIAAGLIAAHRGLLTIESVNGAGTEAIMRFPADRLVPRP